MNLHYRVVLRDKAGTNRAYLTPRGNYNVSVELAKSFSSKLEAHEHMHHFNHEMRGICTLRAEVFEYYI